MKNQISSLLFVSFVFACGAIAVKAVEPTVAQAVPGQFKECYGHSVPRTSRDSSATFTPSDVLVVPNGWTVVGGGNANNWGAVAILCR